MSIIQNHVESPDGFLPARMDRAVLGSMPGIANAAGAAGATVSVAVSLPASANLPVNYAVLINPGQGCMWYVSAKTSSGFTVNLVPLSSTAVIAAGNFDCVLVA